MPAPLVPFARVAREVAAVRQMFINLGVPLEKLSVNIAKGLIGWESEYAAGVVLPVAKRDPRWGSDMHLAQQVATALDWWADKATDDERWKAWGESLVYKDRYKLVTLVRVSGMCGPEVKKAAEAELEALPISAMGVKAEPSWKDAVAPAAFKRK